MQKWLEQNIINNILLFLLQHCIDDVTLKNVKMKSRYIQLPNGVVKDKSKEKTIQLNLLPNYKNNPF